MSLPSGVLAAESSDREIVAQLVAKADAGDSPSAFAQTVGERGISAALVCAEFLDEARPQRSQALYEAIAFAAFCRRSNSETLRLYQPEAFRLFYLTSGIAAQRRIAVGLAWKEWPASLPEAVLRAAPVPLLEWMQTQAKSDTPELEKLRLLAGPIGWWLRTQNERREIHHFHMVLAALALNPAINRDPPTLIALLQMIADAGASASLPFVLQHLDAPQPEVRAVATVALGQLLNPAAYCQACCAGIPAIANAQVADRIQALALFIERAGREEDPVVLAKLAATAEAWPDEPRVGQAMLDLFARVPDAAMRRSILFSVAKTRWPQQEKIILRAFDAPDDGVLSVALQAIVAHPIPELATSVVTRLNAEKEPQPQLIDAAGALADPRAVPQLLRWLERERNAAMRFKLALALEKIPGDGSGRALTNLLEHEGDQMLATNLCRIASRRELPGAAPLLASLAEDSTAPMAIRGQAVWALGRYHEPVARECLARLISAPEKYFSAPGQEALIPEVLEQARLFLTLARLRIGEPGMEEALTKTFETGTPSSQLTCLLALEEMKRDHPVITTGLQSGDFAVLLGAVRAAGAANPLKYQAQLRALQQAPFVTALLSSGLDTWRLPAALDQAIRAGDVAKSAVPK
ncbi:MAG: hypothetical protein WCD79_19120 [Chthoniobacteraceae bacterium]